MRSFYPRAPDKGDQCQCEPYGENVNGQWRVMIENKSNLDVNISKGIKNFRFKPEFTSHY